MADITKIEGIGPNYAEKIKAAGINTTEQLLEHGATPKGRKTIAEKTGISEKQVLRWVNIADLFRIKGIGGQYSDLLEAAGVDTVPEMAQRNANNLFESMVTINDEKNLVRQVPAKEAIFDWVAQAKTLKRIIEY